MTTHSASNWFQDEEALLSELKLAHSDAGTFGSSRGAGLAGGLGLTAATPVIPGYESLVEYRRGGQGVVFEAVQRSTKRRVAIKVLRDWASSSDVSRRRFEREVDLAASLRHPGIVRVYDSGVTNDGRIYLVMEFIEGVALDEFVKASGSDRATLELCAKVCDAIQYAHTRGVIHRDIKPSNVRVESDGTPRVMDFGLAKVGEGSTSGDTPAGITLTTPGQFMGSLPFASPEQARGEHDYVDTRSDVYSLGVTIYQLLTGAFPYDVSGALHAALNNIVNALPAPASSHRPVLRGQLDIILAKALAKAPADRYQSAGELALDLRHHLAGEPISAQREGAWRVVQRNAKRYRIAAGAGSLVLAAVTTASIVSVRAARHAQRQQAEAEAQRAIAKEKQSDAEKQAAIATAEKNRSGATVEFLQSLLSGASTNTSGGGKETKVIDLIDKAAADLPVKFADDPATRASLHTIIGQIYNEFEQYAKSREQYRQTLALTREFPDKMSDVFGRMSAMANLAYIDAAEGKTQEAIDGYRAAIEEYGKLGIARHEYLSGCWSDTGVMLRRLGKLQEADDAYARAYEALPEDKRESRPASVLLANRAMLSEGLGRLDDALLMMERALPMQEKLFGDESMQTNMTRSNYAFLLINAGRASDGIPVMERALAVSEKSAGADNANTLIIMNNLAKQYHDTKQLDKAAALFERCIAVYRGKPGGMVSNALSPMGNLCAVYRDLGRNEGALTLAREQYDLAVKTAGEKSIDACFANNNVGLALEKNGKPIEGEKFIRKAVELSTPAEGPYTKQHTQHNTFKISLGQNLLTQGRAAEARPLLESAYAGISGAFKPEHPSVRKAARAMAMLLRAEGREDEAKTTDPTLPDAAPPATKPK